MTSRSEATWRWVATVRDGGRERLIGSAPGHAHASAEAMVEFLRPSWPDATITVTRHHGTERETTTHVPARAA